MSGHRPSLAAFLATGFACFASSPADAAFLVAAGGTQNVVCDVSNVCSPTAVNAVLNVGQLQTMLASHDVTLLANGPAGNITIAAPLTWSSTHGLEIDAGAVLTINRPVRVRGQAAVTLHWQGDFGLKLGKAGKISFDNLSSSLTTDDGTTTTAWTLFRSISELAQGIAQNPAGYFALAADYNARVDGTYSSPPIVTNDASINSGSVTGLGNSISNFSFKARPRTSTGLFLNLPHRVEHLRLVNVKVIGAWSRFTGALAAYGSLHPEYNVYDVSATGAVSGGRAVGGLIGGFYGGSIVDSHFTGVVQGGEWGGIGGLVGESDSPVITGSYSAGQVAGVGYFGIGGLVGNYAPRVRSAMIANCYSTASVTGDNGARIGGLVGAMSTAKGTFANNYSSGPLSVFWGTAEAIGGSIGYERSATGGRSRNVYWDMTASGITSPSQGAGNVPNDPGLTGLTTAQLQAGLPPGFDPKIWAQNSAINNGLPYLKSNPP